LAELKVSVLENLWASLMAENWAPVMVKIKAAASEAAKDVGMVAWLDIP
jgi:hypothetical protein